MRKLRVVVLMHDYLVPPEDVSGHDLMQYWYSDEATEEESPVQRIHPAGGVVAADGAADEDAEERAQQRHDGPQQHPPEAWRGGHEVHATAGGCRSIVMDGLGAGGGYPTRGRR